MANLDPVVFGRTFDTVVIGYRDGIGVWLAPIFHIATLFVLFLICRYGRRANKAFALYYTLNYSWLLVYVGIVMFFLFYRKMGMGSLAFWSIVPILLGTIVWQWLKELRHPQLDVAFSDIQLWRWIVLPIMIFGFWYPTYTWGQGFSLLPRDLLFSFYGLMPCPTTMVVLGLLSLRYPHGNTGLFNALTLFAVWIGTAQVAIGYVPDYPLALIGYYSLGLILWNKLRRHKGT
jgi:hypothetical protein